MVLISALLFTGCASTMMVSEGDTLAAKGDWDAAVVKYREAYQNNPENLDYRMNYLKALNEAAQIHYNRGIENFNKNNYEAALIELQASIGLDPTLDKAKTALKKTQRVMDSLYHYEKGLEYLKSGKDREARASFKKSLSLNPDNNSSAIELEKLKKQQKTVMDGYDLDVRSTMPIRLEFKETPVKKVFEVLSKLSGINFIFDADIRDEKTTIFIKDATFQQALELILMTNRLGRKVASENSIIIYQATPQKAAQYEEMMIKVFYLTNSDAKKAANLLKTMIKAKDISAYEELNAIIVRSKPDTIELAGKILEALDLADAEVMLEVNIMEINRNKASNLGLTLSPDSISAAVPTTDGTIRLGDLRNLASGDLLITFPSATLNLKKEELEGNILANPRIRVKNNGKAKIHVGDRVPLITTTVNQGVSTENVQYQDVGLKLTVEPTVRQNDEVDIKLGLEVSSIGTKTTTTSGSVVYQIGTRNTETVLRLRDGETQIIGGLINDEESNTTAKIPFLGDIPVLGRLFSNEDKSKVKTEILLSITPRIIRKLEMPDEAATGFLSGRDEDPSARPLLEGFSPEAIEQQQGAPKAEAASPATPYPVSPPPPPPSPSPLLPSAPGAAPAN